MLQTNFEKCSDTSGGITVRSGCNSIGGVFVKIGFSKTGVKKDYKLAMKRHLDIELLDDIIRKLASGKQLPDKNKDHALPGNWMGHRECHIQPGRF